MPAQRHNFIVEQGTTFGKTLLLTIDEATMDLTGYRVRMQARVRIYDDSVLDLYYNADADNDGITMSALDGAIYIEVDALDTAELDFDVAAYGVEIFTVKIVDEVEVDDYVARILEGYITLSKDRVF